MFEEPEGEGYTVYEVISDKRRADLEKFSKRIGIKFPRLELLNCALTHKSYAKEFEPRLKFNERLEFLGDAVLGLAASTYLFNHFKTFTEGDLTKIRSSVVRQSTLTRLAQEIDLGEMLLFGASEFAEGRNRPSNLEDAMEALIGAIYLQHGWEVARDYVFRQFAQEFNHAKITGVPKDYKSKLQEIIQRQPPKQLTYSELGSSGPDHMRVFSAAALIDDKIFGTGEGRSKKAAEQEAARAALKKLGAIDD
ncbi:MAG: ribonuclease III [Selenomonadaceae bacterium]|nr:ribonuclease III [Selenomonadaceae bacterium]